LQLATEQNRVNCVSDEIKKNRVNCVSDAINSETFRPLLTTVWIFVSFCWNIQGYTKTTTGARDFGAVAPKVWDDLPDSIRSSDSITSLKKT